MKNTEILQYLFDESEICYKRTIIPHVVDGTYEYQRGQYDQVYKMKRDLTRKLELGAQALNYDLDNYIAELQRIRKWTIVPRNRRGLDEIIADLTNMREPIKTPKV
jgi:hypothetical protein